MLRCFNSNFFFIIVFYYYYYYVFRDAQCVTIFLDNIYFITTNVIQARIGFMKRIIQYLSEVGKVLFIKISVFHKKKKKKLLTPNCTLLFILQRFQV